MEYRTILIVGGGFAGTVLATRLLREPPSEPTRVVLVEREAEIGRGIAYAMRDFPYLLNVPAGQMTADSARPTDFLEFAQAREISATAADFLPRSLYGDYLRARLGDAIRAAPPETRFERIHGEVIQVSRAKLGTRGSWSVAMADGRRFLEHLRSYGHIHRHRLPESVARRLGQLQTEGKLRIHAGRILAMQPLEGRIAITWRPRASTETMTLIVDRVVNCTGPDYRARRSTHPLVQNLLCSGLLTSDPLELGIEVAESGEVLDTQYRPVSRLYYVGAWLRACHWEATAVPELREHVARLARHLSRSVANSQSKSTRIPEREPIRAGRPGL